MLGRTVCVCRGETLFLLLSLADCADEVRGETRPCYSFVSALSVSWTCRQNCELTCFAHRNPHELQRSRFPEGPRLHSGVVLVWQFAQSFCSCPAPFLRFRFFLAANRVWTSSARYLLRFSIWRSSYCQLVLLVVLSSSKTLSSEASDWSWWPI